MKKVYIYSLVLIVGIVSLIAWDLYKENYRKDYRYYQTDWTYESSESDDLCILVNKKSHNITYFFVLGHTQDHQLCIRYGNNPKFIDPENLGKKRFTKEGVEIHRSEYWVSELLENKKAWSQKISVISQAKILDLTDTNKVYYYRSLIGSSYYPENMVILSFRLVSLLGMYLVIITLFTTFTRLHKNNPLFATIFIFSILGCLSFYLASFFTGSTTSLVFKINFSKNIVSFLSLWFLLSWGNQQLSFIDFGKKEFIKFLLIAIFGLVIEYLGEHISNYLFFNLTQGNENHRYSMFSNGLGYYPLWIYFAVANFMSNLTIYIIALRKKEKIFKIQKSEGTLASSTLASIQSRINPHFLYNALNSISSLARTEPKKTEEMALQLAKFYGQCSDIKSKPMITLAEELEILKSYLMIEKIRFGDRLQVILPDDDDIMDKIIPSFTLQPVVENAIKYGYSTDENVIKIRITAETNDKSLILRIYDSGPPFSGDMHSGYGLSSIAKKLKVLYPGRHAISFINEPEKCVEITINAEYHKTG